MKKITLNEALQKEKGTEPKVTLMQKLAKGELIAEGRYSHTDRFADDILPDDFKEIQRERWLDFEPNFESNEISYHPNRGVEEKYLNIFVLIEENSDKGGRPLVIDRARLNAEIATYYATEPRKKHVSPDDLRDFRKTMLDTLPTLNEFNENSDAGADVTKTPYRALDDFLEHYKRTVSYFDENA